MVHNILKMLEIQGRLSKDKHDENHKMAMDLLKKNPHHFVLPSKNTSTDNDKPLGIFVTFVSTIIIHKEANAKEFLQKIKNHEKYSIDIHIWILDRTASVEAYIRFLCYNCFHNLRGNLRGSQPKWRVEQVKKAKQTIKLKNKE